MAAANWKVGERIVAIHVEIAAPSHAIEDWRTLLAGTKIVLTDGSGAEPTLVLADHY